ncbi:MAG: ion transporter [Pseudomonadota bacterium]
MMKIDAPAQSAPAKGAPSKGAPAKGGPVRRRPPRPYDRLRAGARAALRGRHPAFGKLVPAAIGIFILATAVAVAMETVPDLPPWIARTLMIFELVAVGVFAAEYVLRLLVAKRPLNYALSFWGIVDLLSFLPTLLFLGTDMLAARVLRLLRLVRLLKLFKRETAFDRLTKAVREVGEELSLVAIAAAITLYLAAVGIYFFEHRAQPEDFGSIPQSLWWALVTLTTVGYGDAVPVTGGGRVFAGLVIIVGLGIVALPTALMTAALMRGAKAARDDRHPNRRDEP